MKICIVGTSRCGTTLLRNLIHSHPDISVFNETHWIPRMFEFFGTQRVNYKRLIDVAEKTTWDTGKNLIDVNSAYSHHDSNTSLRAELYRRLEVRKLLTISEFMDELAQTTFGENIVWGDKTPDYGFYMGTIRELWPDCKFIHITRDGLDTSRSMSKHSGCKLMVSAGYDNWCSLSYDGLYEKYEMRALPLKDYTSSWHRRLKRIRNEASRIPDHQYFECSYDDLLQEPRSILTKVMEFSNLKTDTCWLEVALQMIRPPRQKSYSSSALEIALLGPENVYAIAKEAFPSRHFLTIDHEAEAESQLLSLHKNSQCIENRIHTAISVFAFATIISRDSLAARAALSVAETLEEISNPAEIEPWSQFTP
ncbi:sulfotransferase family protein [Gilvimarinus algae]|uniref:Sulfotransferase n=1 Tax=Gilvimarinus algae TaxID=3058037 RepID=A0ABT8TGP4_9GAMM|nr:sulfotransferase [Gilvimarinus sp. SDUM040014]MDO3383257.1 sulfotransferase [Gilvimarinus sp. SDUM040014]